MRISEDPTLSHPSLPSAVPGWTLSGARRSLALWGDRAIQNQPPQQRGGTQARQAPRGEMSRSSPSMGSVWGAVLETGAAGSTESVWRLGLLPEDSQPLFPDPSVCLSCREVRPSLPAWLCGECAGFEGRGNQWPHSWRLKTTAPHPLPAREWWGGRKAETKVLAGPGSPKGSGKSFLPASFRFRWLWAFLRVAGSFQAASIFASPLLCSSPASATPL